MCLRLTHILPVLCTQKKTAPEQPVLALPRRAAACVVLCLGFVTEAALITHQPFSCCSALPQLYFQLLPPVSRLGLHRELWGDTSGTVAPGDHRDIPQYRM